MKRLIIPVVLLFITSSTAFAADSQEKESPAAPKIIYVDKVTYVDKVIYRTLPPTPCNAVSTVKVVKVEVPVYETMTVTSDPATVRTMMKVTHARYVALLALYRQLKAKK
jgi:hypothetical protein